MSPRVLASKGGAAESLLIMFVTLFHKISLV